MKKRRYIIHETNFRDKNGIPLNVKEPENVFEEYDGLGYKGESWWGNGLPIKDSKHALGEPPCSEQEFDVEFDAVELKDGSFYEGGLMDVLYTSYDVETPMVEIEVTGKIQFRHKIKVPTEKLNACSMGKISVGDLVNLDATVYVAEPDNMADSEMVGGVYDIEWEV